MLFRLLRRRFKAAYEAEAEGEGLCKRNHIKRTNKGCTWGWGGGTDIHMHDISLYNFCQFISSLLDPETVYRDNTQCIA